MFTRDVLACRFAVKNTLYPSFFKIFIGKRKSESPVININFLKIHQSLYAPAYIHTVAEFFASLVNYDMYCALKSLRLTKCALKSLCECVN